MPSDWQGHSRRQLRDGSGDKWVPNALSSASSGERVHNGKSPFEDMTVMKILRIKCVASRQQGGRHDQRVPIGNSGLTLDLHRLGDDSRVDRHDIAPVKQLLREPVTDLDVEPEFDTAHIEELVDDLDTDGRLTRENGFGSGDLRIISAERVNNNVRVSEDRNGRIARPG